VCQAVESVDACGIFCVSTRLYCGKIWSVGLAADFVLQIFIVSTSFHFRICYVIAKQNVIRRAMNTVFVDLWHTATWICHARSRIRPKVRRTENSKFFTQLLIPAHTHFHWLKFIKNILKNSNMFRSTTIIREL